jgi:hypothetical protein
VITEFHAGDTDATMHAMAAEILRYWHVMIQLADSISWAQDGALFARSVLARRLQPTCGTPDLLDGTSAAQ